MKKVLTKTLARTSEFIRILKQTPLAKVLALCNVKNTLSHIMESLNPTIPVLPIGVFGHFWAVACVCIGASPNRQNYIFIIALIVYEFNIENLCSQDKM